MADLFKDIPGFGGRYQASPEGQIRLTKNKRIKMATIVGGYQMVSIYFPKRPRTFRVHRLVALTFIPNPDNKPEINHKDGNKSNPCVDNLEWVTRGENADHALNHNLLRPWNLQPIQVQIVDGAGCVRATYPSLMKAARAQHCPMHLLETHGTRIPGTPPVLQVQIG